MLKKLVVVATLMVGSQAALAGFENFGVVVSDATIAMAGTTREAYNKKNPEAEKLWRAAWAAEGTKKDTPEFAHIRKDAAKPADMMPRARTSSPKNKGQ